MIRPHHAYYHTVLALAAERGPIHRRDLRDLAAVQEQLGPEEFDLANDRGTNIFNSRIHWASQDLFIIGAIERPSRGIIAITDFGRDLLRKYPNGFDRKQIKTFPEWVQYEENLEVKGPRAKRQEKAAQTIYEDTPDERLDSALEELNTALASELVRKIQALKPVAMERLVLQLLHAMGYGDNEEAMEHLGGSGDEGVDGVINLDALGLQKIYIQAKRYQDGAAITPTTVQAFIGALDSKRAVGGVFITTSDFTKSASEAAQKSSRHIELINGRRLGELLIQHKVGVRTTAVIYRAELDESHFEDLEG